MSDEKEETGARHMQQCPICLLTFHTHRGLFDHAQDHRRRADRGRRPQPLWSAQ